MASSNNEKISAIHTFNPVNAAIFKCGCGMTFNRHTTAYYDHVEQEIAKEK